MGTVIVLLLLALIVGAAVYSMIRDKKSGKGGCGCGCMNCAMRGQCHKE